MNLVTKENLFITGFVLIIVVGIQYLMYLEIKKTINKRLNQLNHKVLPEKNQVKNQVLPEKNQVNMAKVNMAKVNMAKVNLEKKNVDDNEESTTDENDNDEDSDSNSNIDSYVNPLPSVNNNDDD